MDKGKPLDMLKLGVVEPLRVKSQAIQSAAEAAAMILRIDDVYREIKYPSDKSRPQNRRSRNKVKFDLFWLNTINITYRSHNAVPAIAIINLIRVILDICII